MTTENNTHKNIKLELTKWEGIHAIHMWDGYNSTWLDYVYTVINFLYEYKFTVKENSQRFFVIEFAESFFFYTCTRQNKHDA